MTATIHAHPSLHLPSGWTWGAPAAVAGYTAWHVLHDSGAAAIVVERPDYPDEIEDLDDFEAELAEVVEAYEGEPRDLEDRLDQALADAEDLVRQDRDDESRRVVTGLGPL